MAGFYNYDTRGASPASQIIFLEGRLKEVEGERDALAATLLSLRDFVTPASESKESAMARIDSILDHSEPDAILSARDARTNEDALRAAELRCAKTEVLIEGLHPYTALQVQKMMMDAVSGRMADAIEKEAGNV